MQEVVSQYMAGQQNDQQLYHIWYEKTSKTDESLKAGTKIPTFFPWVMYRSANSYDWTGHLGVIQ